MKRSYSRWFACFFKDIIVTVFSSSKCRGIVNFLTVILKCFIKENSYFIFVISTSLTLLFSFTFFVWLLLCRKLCRFAVVHQINYDVVMFKTWVYLCAFIIQLLFNLVGYNFKQLKKEGRRNEYERHKLEALNQRQKMVS